MLDELRDLYQEVILDHGKEPRNFRKPDNANCEATGLNPLCGDRLVVYLSVDESNIVQDAAFLGNGCAISMASASMMSPEILCRKASGTKSVSVSRRPLAMVRVVRKLTPACWWAEHRMSTATALPPLRHGGRTPTNPLPQQLAARCAVDMAVEVARRGSLFSCG